LKPVAAALSTLLLCLAPASHASEQSARIVTLTPHATEMVFAAGAGGQVVATVESSNYPPAAQGIERIGDGLNTSAEQVLAYTPDWVVGWPSPLMSQLQSLGIRTWVSSPESLEAIGTEVLAMADSFGDQEVARDWHDHYIERLGQMGGQSDQPINVVVLASTDGQFVIGQHALINDALARCAAVNAFGHSRAQAPQVSLEGLIAVKPDVLISGRALDKSAAVPATTPLRVVDADTLYRPGPRFIEAALEICHLVQQLQAEIENR
jgi:vitamin B12 transport system substrate-binding protein